MAIGAGAIWTVRPGGNANNGAGFVPGTGRTDFSQQTDPELVVTGVSCVEDSTTLDLNAAAILGGTDLTGNMCCVVSGVNAITGLYQIQSNTDVAVVLDRSPCTAGAGSGLVVRIGGAGGASQAGIEKVLSAAVAGNRIRVAGGTYAKTGGGEIVVDVGAPAVRASDGFIACVQRSLTDIVIEVLDEDGEPVDLSEADLSLQVADVTAPHAIVETIASLVGAGTYGNAVTITPTDVLVAEPGTFRAELWRTDGDVHRVWSGTLQVLTAADPEPA
jgi:hypothetical protein